jgi:hypothetical protein
MLYQLSYLAATHDGIGSAAWMAAVRLGRSWPLGHTSGGCAQPGFEAAADVDVAVEDRGDGQQSGDEVAEI